MQREPFAAEITYLVQRQAAEVEEEEKVQTTPTIQGIGSKCGPTGPDLEQARGRR